MRLSLSLLLAFVAAAPAAADCRSAPGNLLAGRNCGFDAGVAGWSGPEDVTVAHEPGQGSPGKGALRASGAQGSILVRNGCLAIRPATSYRAAVRVRAAAGVPYFCGFTVWQYTDDACQDGQEPFLAAGAPPRQEWQNAEQSGVSSATARSAELRLDCSGEAGVAVLYDDLFFGPG
jgi:hypothetical protein